MHCPGCGRALQDVALPAGQQVICAGCATVFVVPGEVTGLPPVGAGDGRDVACEDPSAAPPAPPVVCEPEPPPLPTSAPASPAPGAVETETAEGPAEGDVGRSGRLIRVLVGLVIVLAVLIAGLLGTRWARRSLRTPRLGSEPTQAQLIEQLHDPEPAVRRNAARTLAGRGPASVEAALADVTNVPDEDGCFIVESAVPALASVGRDLAVPLGELLRSPRVNVRVGAARVLCEMGPLAASSSHRLRQALADPHRLVRAFAADALGQLGDAATPAVPDLIALLDHADRHTRLHAARALGNLGPKARPASAALKRRWEQDDDRSVREAAMVACHQVDLEALARQAAAKASEAVQTLIRQLDDADPLERATAARALGSRGFDAADAVPSLARALGDRDPWVREAAAKALGALGEDSRSVLPSLRRALNDPQSEVRDAAQASLSTLERHTGP